MQHGGEQERAKNGGNPHESGSSYSGCGVASLHEARPIVTSGIFGAKEIKIDLTLIKIHKFMNIIT
jgi:hypothetical protein